MACVGLFGILELYIRGCFLRRANKNERKSKKTQTLASHFFYLFSSGSVNFVHNSDTDNTFMNR
ncbi:MAG: hypothetical protein DWQ10_05030 [Calditrichaeota bacterium]|nr:MAG: hypothetical protein DWQ10_05030 [Calditrichota bacterium]